MQGIESNVLYSESICEHFIPLRLFFMVHISGNSVLNQTDNCKLFNAQLTKFGIDVLSRSKLLKHKVVQPFLQKGKIFYF